LKKKLIGKFASARKGIVLTSEQKQFLNNVKVYWQQLRGIDLDKEVVEWESDKGAVYLVVRRCEWPLVELTKSMRMRLLDLTSVCDHETLALAPESIPHFVGKCRIVKEIQAHGTDRLSGQNVN
jgi:hypothetical protein